MVGEEGGSFDQMRFATVDGVGLVISWVFGLAVRWSGRSGLGGDVGTVSNVLFTLALSKRGLADKRPR